MTANNIIKTLDEIKKIPFDVFKKENDRSCVILSCSFFDSLLKDLLEKSVVQESKKIKKNFFEGPLSTFSSRIHCSYLFGLISKYEHDDLNTIREIRNDFAHLDDHGLSFQSKDIADKVMSLYTPTLLLNDPKAKKIHWCSYLNSPNPRKRFEIGTLLLFTGLRVRIKKAAPIKHCLIVFNKDNLVL